jgi:ATP-dependent Clp protease ATP-binding subunit ClpA
MDEIILFPPISHADMIRITESKLIELGERMRDLGYTLKIADGVAAHIAQRSHERRFGVRHVLRLIATKIENPISALIVESSDEERKRPIEVGVEGTEIVVRYKIPSEII